MTMRGDIDQQTGTSPAGLTRGSIVLREKVLRRGWMAGASPAMTEERARFHIGLPDDLVVEVAPVRVHRKNEVDLPLSRPMLDVLLSLDRSGGSVVALVVNQHLHAIALGETRHEAFPVLKGATDQIVGHADIERAAPTIGEDVDPETHLTPVAGLSGSPAGL